MNNRITLGQYKVGTTFYHKLEARSKIFIFLVLIVFSLMTDSIFFNLILFVGLLLFSIASGVKKKTLINNLAPAYIMVLITILFHLFFPPPGGEPLAEFGGITVTGQSLYLAGFYSTRMLLFVLATFIITFSSLPTDLIDGSIRYLTPLEKIKIPIRDLSMILFIALRSIPVVYEEYASIKDAQKLRGVKFGGSIIKNIKNFVSIIKPLFLSLLRRADILAESIWLRGGGEQFGSIKKTYYLKNKLGRKDFSFALLSLLFITATYYLTISEKI